MKAPITPVLESGTLPSSVSVSVSVCVVLALALAPLLGCTFGTSGDTPGLVVLPGMTESVPFDAYDPNPLGSSGGTLRLPPVGAVAWDGGPAGRARILGPIAAPTKADLARGKLRYETFCVVCHGAGGVGDGRIIGRFPNPPSLLADHAIRLTDDKVFEVITKGQGIMASYAVQVLAADRWKVVAWVRALQAAGTGVGGP